MFERVFILAGTGGEPFDFVGSGAQSAAMGGNDVSEWIFLN